MKRILSFVLAAAMLLCLAACTPVSKDSIEPAVYRLEDEQYPRLSLRDDGTFFFIYTVIANRTSKGTYSVSDKVLKLECEDGTVYCFDIKRDALEFNGELSDKFVKQHENEPELVDGTVLELWRTFE